VLVRFAEHVQTYVAFYCLAACSAVLLACRYAQGGNSMCIAPLSERGGAGGGRQDRRIAFAQIDSEGLGMNGQADWVQVCVVRRGQLPWLSHSLCFRAGCLWMTIIIMFASACGAC
jgi:hypothetical protein